jgi:DNA-binding transcriptional regulator YiaG
MATIQAVIHRKTAFEQVAHGRKCIKLMKEHDLSVDILADRYGVSTAAVRKWMRAAKNSQRRR